VRGWRKSQCWRPVSATGLGGSGGVAGSGGTGGSGGMAASGGSGGNGSEDGNFAAITVGEMVFTFPPDELNGCNNFANQIGGSFAIDDNGDPIQAGGGEGIQVNFAIVAPGSGGRIFRLSASTTSTPKSDGERKESTTQDREWSNHGS